MKILKILAILAVVGALTLAACTSTNPPPSLNNTRWVLATLKDQPARPNPAVTLSFENGQLSGSDGCNRYGTTYTLSGGKLTINPQIASTLMACDEPVMRQATAFLTVLPQVAAYRGDGQQLTLLDAGGKTLATFKAQ